MVDALRADVATRGLVLKQRNVKGLSKVTANPAATLLIAAERLEIHMAGQFGIRPVDANTFDPVASPATMSRK